MSRTAVMNAESYLIAYGLDVPTRCLRVVGQRQMRAALNTFRRCGFAVAVLRLSA